MPIIRRMRSDVVILDLVDPLDDEDFKQLRGHAVDAFSSVGGGLVLNLSRTTLMRHLEPSHLRRIGVFYTDNGRTPALAAASPETREVLDGEMLTAVFDIYDTEDKAVKSFA